MSADESDDHMSSSPGEYEKQNKIKPGLKENTLILKSHFFSQTNFPVSQYNIY